MKFTVEPTTVNELHGPRISKRMREVISRMSDKEMLTVDINAVMAVIYLQHTYLPIADIPDDWWKIVMEGARIK